MRRTLQTIGAILFFTALLYAGPSLGNAKAHPEKAAALAPELQKLSFLIGDWHYTTKYEKSAMMPDGGTGEGIYRAAIGPGGHSVLTDFEESAGPLAGIAAHEVFAWDPAKSALIAYSVVSNAPGCFLRAGNWEKDQLVFTREMSAGAKTVRMRAVYTEARPDAITIETYVGAGDAPLALAFITRAKKP